MRTMQRAFLNLSIRFRDGSLISARNRDYRFLPVPDR
jgi:hypothetical protein